MIEATLRFSPIFEGGAVQSKGAATKLRWNPLKGSHMTSNSSGNPGRRKKLGLFPLWNHKSGTFLQRARHENWALERAQNLLILGPWGKRCLGERVLWDLERERERKRERARARVLPHKQLAVHCVFQCIPICSDAIFHTIRWHVSSMCDIVSLKIPSVFYSCKYNEWYIHTHFICMHIYIYINPS